MSSSFKLSPITFNDLHVSEITGYQFLKAQKPEAHVHEEPESYEDKFSEKIKHLRTLILQKNSDLNFKEAWKKTLDHFSKVKLLDSTYEDRLFAIFKDQEFELRYSSLLGLYRELKSLYNSAGDSHVKVAERITELTSQIIGRQEEFYTCFTSLPSEDQTSFSWEKLFNKSITHLLVNIEKKDKNFLTDKITVIWKKNKDPIICLRRHVYGLSFISEKDASRNAFEKVLVALQEIISQPLNEKNIKELHKIFRCIYFDDNQEKRIFDALSKSTGNTPLLDQIRFKIFCFYSYCKKLKSLHRVNINADELLKQFEATVKFLGDCYSSGHLSKTDWDNIYDSCNLLPLSKDVKKGLLEIFPSYKIPTAPASGYIYTYSKYIVNLPYTLFSMLKSTVTDGEARWKGDKYLTILQDTRQWFLTNEKWITEQLEDKNNPQELKKKVAEIQKFFKEMTFPEISSTSSIEERGAYNTTLREMSREYLAKLREALSMPECMRAFERYASSTGNTVGCALVLMQLCHQRFTGINMVPFIAKTTEDMINIGLKLLAEEDTCYRHFLNREFYPKPLDIGTEMIHKAIEKVPSEYRTPQFTNLAWKIRNVTDYDWDPHMQGAPNINLLNMTLKFPDKSVKTITWLRFATPTNNSDINPEFRGFLQKKRVLLCSLLSNNVGYEAKRTEQLLNLNSNCTFVTVFPVLNSALFNQENEYADTKLDEPAFSTKSSFFNAIMKEIIPDPRSPLKKGSYLFPDSWMDDEFKQLIDKCLSQTNDIFFSNAQTLTSKQRRAFIKFFDVCLAFALIQYSKVDFFAFLCNHSSDRTGIFVTLMLKILLIAFGKEHKPIYSNQPDAYTWNHILEAMIDGVPMIIAKREMNSFYNGLVEALEILEDRDVRERIIEYRDEVVGAVSDFDFPFASLEESKSFSPGKQEKEEKQVRGINSTYQSFTQHTG